MQKGAQNVPRSACGGRVVRREERGPHGVQAACVLHKLERRKRLRDRRPAGGIRLVQAQGVPLEPGRQGRSSARSCTLER